MGRWRSVPADEVERVEEHQGGSQGSTFRVVGRRDVQVSRSESGREQSRSQPVQEVRGIEHRYWQSITHVSIMRTVD
jgi:hypothetical protein